MNVQLLERVAAHIEANPEEYDQMEFCGTACCIGGWALKFAGRNFQSHELPSEVAAQVLEINKKKAHRLFFGADESRSPFKAMWDISNPDRGEIGAARIRHFIATEGAE